LGFRVAYETCVAGLSIQVQEPACVCQVLQADVAQQRWWQGARFFLLHRGLSFRSGPPPSSPWASFYPTDRTHSPGIFCTRIPLASGVPAGCGRPLLLLKAGSAPASTPAPLPSCAPSAASQPAAPAPSAHRRSGQDPASALENTETRYPAAGRSRA